MNKLSFTPHAEVTTKKIQITLQQINPISRPSSTIILSIYQIQTRIWMHNKWLQNPPKNHIKQQESAQTGSLSLILRTISPYQLTQLKMNYQ